MSSSNQTIIPRDCSYGCNTRIFWNTSENAYFEVFAKKKHICPNRSNNKIGSGNLPGSNTSNTNRTSSFYNKKPLYQKPKMSNSLELLSGPIANIQKKYEILSDIVTEVGGKTGSQSHIMPDNSISLVVYYEVPEGKRNER
jgi:hypothetical protein